MRGHTGCHTIQILVCSVITEQVLLLALLLSAGSARNHHYSGGSSAPGSRCYTRLGELGRCSHFSVCVSVRPVYWATTQGRGYWSTTQGHGYWVTTPPTLCSDQYYVPLVCCPVNIVRKVGSRYPPRNIYRQPHLINATTNLNGKPALNTPATTTTNAAATTFTAETTTIGTTSSTGNPFNVSTARGNSNNDYRCGRTPGAAPSLSGSVVGGEEVTPNSRPWMAVLGEVQPSRRLAWFCGATLVAPTVVMTAAHCAAGRRRIDIVRVGGHNLSSPAPGPQQQDLRVEKVILHPRYRPPALAHDLALLVLSQPVDINTSVLPVCLPNLSTTRDNGSVMSGALRSRGWSGLSMRVAGWGSQRFNSDRSAVLRESSVTVLPLRNCRSAYRTLPDFRRKFPGGLSESFLCAGDTDGQTDACQGDSGGPLVYAGDGRGVVMTGIVAAGYGCANKRFPGLYTNILSHMPWISKQLSQLRTLHQ